MTDIVQQIEDALAGMTPPPWKARIVVDDLDMSHEINAGGMLPIALIYADAGERNASGIAALRDLTPALVAEVKRLRAENKVLREALAQQAEWHEAADKAISKQPNANSGPNGWMRLQHQEQAAHARAALEALK